MTDLTTLTIEQLTNLQTKQAALIVRMSSKQGRLLSLDSLVTIERELKRREASYIPTLVASL